MSNLIYTIIVCCIVLLLALLLAGCSVLGGNTKPPTIIQPPPPGEQLWEAAKKSNWLVTLSILGVAAGVFALVNGAVKLGTASIASASVSLFMALAVARFALWMAVFGLIGSIAAALFSIFVRRKALIEIIKGVQTIKNVSVDPDNAKVILNDTQSSSTKQIVGNIKNSLKLLGVI